MLNSREQIWWNGEKPYLTISKSTSLSIPTKHPTVTQTMRISIPTHILTSHAALFRRIHLELRTPFHSITPELQILNPSAAFSIFFSTPPSNVSEFQNRISCCYAAGFWGHSEEQVHHAAEDCAHQEKGQKCETAEFWVALPTTHLRFWTEMKDPEIVIEIICRVRVVGFGKSDDVGKAWEHEQDGEWKTTDGSRGTTVWSVTRLRMEPSYPLLFLFWSVLFHMMSLQPISNNIVRKIIF